MKVKPLSCHFATRWLHGDRGVHALPFWAFLSLIAVSVIILHHPNRTRAEPAFRTPLFPLLPLLFCDSFVYLTVWSVRYSAADQGGFISLLVLASGLVALHVSLCHHQRNRKGVVP
jgi:hypothetical protein